MNNPTTSLPSSGGETGLSSNWFESHVEYLFNFAIGQLRDTSVAEDLLQETFLAALKSANRFSGRSTERVWLVGILRHKIYDHLRQTCRERAVRIDPLPAKSEESWEESALWLHDIAAKTISIAASIRAVSVNLPSANSRDNRSTKLSPAWSASCPSARSDAKNLSRCKKS